MKGDINMIDVVNEEQDKKCTGHNHPSKPKSVLQPYHEGSAKTDVCLWNMARYY